MCFSLLHNSVHATTSCSLHLIHIRTAPTAAFNTVLPNIFSILPPQPAFYNTAFTYTSDRRNRHRRRRSPTRYKASRLRFRNFCRSKEEDSDSIVSMTSMVGIDHYIVGIFVASFLGFILLSSLFRPTRKKDRHSSAGFLSESSDDGEVRTDQRPGTDVVIVGAGVAGAALAFTLGKRVLGYGIFKDGKHTKLSYPLEKFHADVAGRSFHNGRFIQRMREKAASLPNVKLEQGTVTSLIEENGIVKGVQYKTKDGEEMKAYAPLTVVCDGCFSNLRRSLCSPMIDVPSHFVGLVLENCQLPFPNHGHVIFADPSPILFYPISSSEIRCLVDVPGQKLPSIANGEMGKYLKTVVASQPVASTINTLAGALYKVFCASPDEAHEEMRKACFDYLSLGGEFSSGPIALLSGLNPRPLSLVVHFFSVAVYGVGRLWLPFPSLKRLWLGVRLLMGAAGIIFPIIKAEGVRQMFFPATVPAYYRALRVS
ncbi:hypothetical protein Cgig2_009559 [Carnegiea gigantea]|uniref:Squalene monooxygenase n=1 Tax=Carnegiea gigantea TaxID=171969 RepID=A0A9Q1KB69_9CARY|nr:hypothetical protein Cgig2_009559 [Carnegiea gigantea]